MMEIVGTPCAWKLFQVQHGKQFQDATGVPITYLSYCHYHYQGWVVEIPYGNSPTWVVTSTVLIMIIK